MTIRKIAGPRKFTSLLKYVDLLLPNEREACKLAQVDDAERAVDILSQKVAMVVVKRGSQGALARVSNEKYVAVPPVVEVADHVGAGDSFDAGFIHQFIRGGKHRGLSCVRKYRRRALSDTSGWNRSISRRATPGIVSALITLRKRPVAKLVHYGTGTASSSRLSSKSTWNFATGPVTVPKSW